MNKKIFLITIIILTISLMMFMFYGCDSILDKLANPEADAAAEQLVKDILSNDLSDITDNIHPSVLDTVNNDIFEDMRSRIEGDYVSLTAISRNVNKQTTNGVSSSTYGTVYKLLTSTDKEYNFSTTWLVNSQGKGFTQFVLAVQADNPANNGANIALLIYSILMILFAIASFIVCLNTNMDKKGLYAVLIVVLFCGFTSSNGDTGAHVKINFIFSYLSRYFSADNNIIFSINFPIGAIAFWSNRKKMMKKYSDRQKAMIELLRPKAQIDTVDTVNSNSDDVTVITESQIIKDNKEEITYNNDETQ